MKRTKRPRAKDNLPWDFFDFIDSWGFLREEGLNRRSSNIEKGEVIKLGKIIDMIDDKTAMDLYRFTKKLIEDNKDITIVQAMKHDSYKRIKRRIRQVGWSEY